MTTLDEEIGPLWYFGISFSFRSFQVPSGITNDGMAEPITLRLQICNLNEGHMYDDYRYIIATGANIAILTLNLAECTSIETYTCAIESLRRVSPRIIIAVVILQSNQEPTPDALLHDVIEGTGQRQLEINQVTTIDEMMGAILKQCGACMHCPSVPEAIMTLPVHVLTRCTSCPDGLAISNSLIVLLIHSVDELPQRMAYPLRFYEDLPQYWRPRAAFAEQSTSKNLRELLQSRGYTFSEKNTIQIVKESRVFQIDLNANHTYVMRSICTRCHLSITGCTLGKKRLCIVPHDDEDPGYSTADLGLTSLDLFVLATIYSIENDLLPDVVIKQIPRVLPCLKNLSVIHFFWLHLKHRFQK